MAENPSDANELAAIRQLALEPDRVELTTTAKYDILGAGVSKSDLCETIVAWIDGGGRVKRVSLRGKHEGQAAYEIKPRIGNTLFYLKLTLCDLGERDEYLLIISAHPDH